MNTFSTDALLFSKWTKESQYELADRFYLVVACPLQEQEMDWHELEDPAHWHMGWN